MAIGNNRDDQQGTLQQGSTGLMGVGGPQASTGNAVKTPAKRKTSTGFVGLQNYLTNNPSAGANATQKLGNEATAVNNQVTQGTQQVSSAITGQHGTGMGQTYTDVDMNPVKSLEERAGKVQKQGQQLASGDFLGYRGAQGGQPDTAMGNALYQGMMGATMAGQSPQVNEIAKQNVATEALKGLAGTQETQRTAFNREVQSITDQTLAANAAAANAANMQNSGAPAPRRNSDFWNTLEKATPDQNLAINQRELATADTELGAASVQYDMIKKSKRTGPEVDRARAAYMAALAKRNAARSKYNPVVAPLAAPPQGVITDSQVRGRNDTPVVLDGNAPLF